MSVITIENAPGYIDGERVESVPYKVCNGTYYDRRTPDEVVHVLDRVRASGERVVIRYGHSDWNPADKGETPRSDWGEENDVSGTVGRSTGRIKIPLLIEQRGHDGPGILDHCITRIGKPNGGKLWEWSGYRAPEFTACEPYAGDVPKGYRFAASMDGKLVAQFTTVTDRNRYIWKMQRFCGTPPSPLPPPA